MFCYSFVRKRNAFLHLLRSPNTKTSSSSSSFIITPILLMEIPSNWIGNASNAVNASAVLLLVGWLVGWCPDIHAVQRKLKYFNDWICWRKNSFSKRKWAENSFDMMMLGKFYSWNYKTNALLLMIKLD